MHRGICAKEIHLLRVRTASLRFAASNSLFHISARTSTTLSPRCLIKQTVIPQDMLNMAYPSVPPLHLLCTFCINIVFVSSA
ncbi:hypothetical protein MHYP_G00196960 [Metynnis hypsauchen]